MSAGRREPQPRARGPRRAEEHDEYDEYGDVEEYGEYDSEEEPRRAARRMSAVDAAEAGLRQITAVTTKGAEGVTSVRPAEDGWTVGVELLDARHIPSSCDTLALYEVELDAEGELKSYRRVARYSRSQGSEAS